VIGIPHFVQGSRREITPRQGSLSGVIICPAAKDSGSGELLRLLINSTT
jgi:hypothetical protein